MLHIYVTDVEDGRREITDLYWFEENLVHDWKEQDPWHSDYLFEIFLDDALVWSSAVDDCMEYDG